MKFSTVKLDSVTSYHWNGSYGYLLRVREREKLNYMEHNFAECCLREWSAKLNTRTFKSRVFEFLEVSDVVCSLLYLHSHQSVFPCPFHSMLRGFEYHFFKNHKMFAEWESIHHMFRIYFSWKPWLNAIESVSRVNSAHAGQIDYKGAFKTT